MQNELQRVEAQQTEDEKKAKPDVNGMVENGVHFLF